MKCSLHEQVLDMTGAKHLVKQGKVQTLWSDYGEIGRYLLEGDEPKTIIIKHVKLPDQSHHPRGWNTERSHKRKIQSYQVECEWYERYSSLCDDTCRVPETIGTSCSDNEFLIVMEDLSASGFSSVKENASFHDMTLCLSWLANFHATFMHHNPEGLWPTGTYWHLATRPDELAALKDIELKKAAAKIDSLLSNSPYQTIVHGDAKLANFCFAKDESSVAAVDYQYVGGGCGMKDVAYFIGSCLTEDECEHYESKLLDIYFDHLAHALRNKQANIDADLVEEDWRELYAVAWTDFHRFLKGWSPGHWKIHGYSERLSSSVLKQLS